MPPKKPGLPVIPDINDPTTQVKLLEAIRGALWEKGNLEYRLTQTQQAIHATLKDNPGRRRYLLCSRRLGKTDLCFTRCVEVALQKPGARILYLAPHTKDAALLAQDTAAVVNKDCPAKLRPAFNSQDKEFKFPNGSIIRLKGVNSETAQYLRGGAYDLVVLDEAGLMDDFLHVLNDIVEPMVLTTRGHVLIATTPPRSPGHESVIVYEQYAARGWVSKYTLREADDTLIPFEEKCRALINAGESLEDAPQIVLGLMDPKTTTAKREFFCEFVTDASLAIVPEFTKEAQRQIVRDYPRPPYFDYYCGVDPGSRDNTGIVYGYVDFKKATLVIEDEALLVNPTTDAIAKTLVQIETDTFHGKEPRCRVSDIDLRLIQDLHRAYRIRLTPADKKDGMLASVQLLRHLVQSRRLVINPKCKHTIRQLENAIWNAKATDMARAGEATADGHYDMVAALRYMIRAIQWQHNPYPEGYYDPGGEGGTPLNSWVSPKSRKVKGWGLYTDTPVTRILRNPKK